MAPLGKLCEAFLHESGREGTTIRLPGNCINGPTSMSYDPMRRIDSAKRSSTLKQDPLYNKNRRLLECVESYKPTAEKLIDVRRCLEKRADVNTTDENGNTPLHLAVRQENIIIVKLLLKRGADLNKQNKYGRTPLGEAVCFKSISILELLLNQKDKGNAWNNNISALLTTALVSADFRKGRTYTRIMELLLNKGADVNAKTKGEETLLHLAVALGCERAPLVELLLNRGAEINAQDEFGNTALHKAVQRNKTSVVELLLNNGADIYVQNGDGYTSLHLAALQEQTANMELLLNKCGNVNAKIKGDDTPLQMAVRFGNPYIVEMMLNKGADVNAQTTGGYTLLHAAARSGKVPVLQLLLNRGAKVNAQTTDGNTPLHEAARSMEASVLDLLLNTSADVKMQATNGYTPLHVVVCCLQNYMTQFLPNIVADLKEQTTTGNSPPPQFAVEFNPSSIAELLLNKGANVNAQTENGYTLLHYAARSGDTSFIQLLVNHGANVNMYTKNGYMPLHGAARSGILSTVELLLNKGANIKAQTTAGQTPLHEAVRSKETSVVELLLNQNVDVKAKGKAGRTPLHEAARSGNISVVELLLTNGADVNAEDRFGNTSLHKAVQCKKLSIVELLLNNSADVNKRDESGDTPLHEAALFGEKSLVELLINNNADVNALNANGETPLHNGAYSGETSTLKLLLQQKANVNALSRNKVTPLHRAVQSGEASMVELLLNEGAHINAQNTDGNTPLHEAARHSNAAIATLLVRRGADLILKNEMEYTPLAYAQLFSFKHNMDIVNLLQTAEQASGTSLMSNNQSHDFSEIFNNQDMISNNRPQNDEVMYLKTDDDCGFLGQLYETKMITLVFVRVLNHERIEPDFFLGVNVHSIGPMDDICLRYQVHQKDHKRRSLCVFPQIPVVIFLQAKHRKVPRNGKFSEKDLWSNSGDFSLRKYFKSYLMIRERFQVNNADPMFKGNFCDFDCYFVFYTSAMESHIKKKTENKINEIVHDLINTGQNTQPFQYSYDEANILDLLTRDAANDQINPMEYDVDHVKDFFSKLWFYTNQAKENEVERIVKDEINKHYNNKKDGNNVKFELHSNEIFLKVHHQIQNWWKLKGKAPYLKRSNDLFRFAKLACLADVVQVVGNAMNYFIQSADLQFNHVLNQRDLLIGTPGTLNQKLCRLLKLINKEDMLINVYIDFKNEIVKLLTDDSNSIIENDSAQTSSDPSQNDCTYARSASLDVASNYGLLHNEEFEYLKKDGTSEVGGTLFRIKVLCLVLLRLQNHEQIEQNPLLGTRIRGIRCMNDVCLRYKAKGQQRPVVVFMKLIYRDDPVKGKLSIDEELSDDLEHFSLQNYFASYFEIKDKFHDDIKDPMFEGDFCDVDCYFILYTTAKISLKKKKTGNKVSALVQDVINTGQNSEPFQYEHDEADIDCLTKVAVKKRIVQLGSVFLKSGDSGKTVMCKPNIMADKLITRYHVVMGREVLQQCEMQPANQQYSIWEFRPEFFESDDEYLIVLKKTVVEIISLRCGDQDNVINESEREVNAINKLLLLKFKLPLVFGNLDMTFRGSEDKVQKRMKFVADKLMQLLKLNKDTKIIQINEVDVGPGKIIEQGIIDINGGIGSAVGNLLVFDTGTNMLKFDWESKTLSKNAALFLKELKDDRHRPYNEDLSAYRIKINVNGFPKESFNGDEFDMRQAKDFLSKFWFYPNQATDDEVERILKGEIGKKYSDNGMRYAHNNYRNMTDIISLSYCHQIQMWWMQTCESPYLSRASELFEHAELADMYNLLQTVINYMYISDVYTIDIKVKQVNKDEQYDQMHQMFKKISAKLFNLFDPLFNKSIDFKYGSSSSKYFDRFKLSLRIHPNMEWVTLVLIAGFQEDTMYRIFTKATPSRTCRTTKNRFLMYEQTFSGRQCKLTRDCLEDTFV